MMQSWHNENLSYQEKAWKEAVRLESEVAAVFLTLGATVEREAHLAGSQIDILVREEEKSGWIRTAVECKSSQRPIGPASVRAFSALSSLLTSRGLVDRAMIVSRIGFTSQAKKLVKAESNIELVAFGNLMQRVKGREDEYAEKLEALQAADEKERTSAGRPRLFVVMPFGPKFEDVYVLGIRETAEKLNLIVERAHSYGLAAHELGLIEARAAHINSDSDLSSFVADAENAISREHTMWTARRDKLGSQWPPAGINVEGR